jgi:hypothetical protein
MSDSVSFTVDDTAPSLVGTITNKDGTAFNLTGFTVRLALRGAQDGRLKVDAPAVVTSSTGGLVRYDWSVGDLDTPGSYEVRWRVLNTAGGAVEHSDPVNTLSVAL